MVNEYFIGEKSSRRAVATRLATPSSEPIEPAITACSRPLAANPWVRGRLLARVGCADEAEGLVQVVHGTVEGGHELVAQVLAVRQVPPPPALVQAAPVACNKRDKRPSVITRNVSTASRPHKQGSSMRICTWLRPSDLRATDMFTRGAGVAELEHPTGKQWHARPEKLPADLLHEWMDGPGMACLGRRRPWRCRTCRHAGNRSTRGGRTRCP